jgi:alanyl-tRNA synthetase
VKTDRLYYSDSYLTSFRATLVDQRDEGRRVYLDRTAFYPTSGGQLFDTGRLGGIRVVEVVDEDDQIAHLLEAPLPVGAVEGVVDWRRRFDHMQQHSGQHLLSAVFANEFGCQTVSVHFGDATATLDLDVGALGPAEIRRAESRANALVTENLSVQVAFEDAAAATGLRKASGRSGPIRIVTIAGLDRSACGGTHVRATGEIGPILIRKVERVKKLVRLEFLCGGRAVARARADFELLSELASPASAGIDDLPGLIEKQRAELKGSESVRRAMETELHGYQARELYQAARPDETGRRCILHQAAGGTMESCRGLAQAVTALPNTVLIATLTAPPAVLLAASPDSGIDAGHLLRSVVSDLGGRGGGTARLAQGTVPGEAAIDAVLARLTSAVQGSR